MFIWGNDSYQRDFGPVIGGRGDFPNTSCQWLNSSTCTFKWNILCMNCCMILNFKLFHVWSLVFANHLGDVDVQNTTCLSLSLETLVLPHLNINLLVANAAPNLMINDSEKYKLKIKSLFFLSSKKQKKERIQTIQLSVHQLLMAEVSMPRLISNVSLNSKICFLKIAIDNEDIISKKLFLLSI